MADHPGLLLLHDVLDAQLVDKRDQKVGRVDELLLDLSCDPPRVTAILIGGTPRANRTGRLARLVRRGIRALLRRRHDPVSRVSFDDVCRIGDNIQIDVDGDSLESAQLEVWLRDHIICRIPGASGEAK